MGKSGEKPKRNGDVVASIKRTALICIFIISQVYHDATSSLLLFFGFVFVFCRFLDFFCFRGIINHLYR